MSRLYERMAVACARLVAKTEPDGEGGFKTVTTDEPLRYGDLFQRAFDGQVFRCTSNADDGAAPCCASFSFGQCSAEEWEVPDGD